MRTVHLAQQEDARVFWHDTLHTQVTHKLPRQNQKQSIARFHHLIPALTHNTNAVHPLQVTEKLLSGGQNRSICFYQLILTASTLVRPTGNRQAAERRTEAAHRAGARPGALPAPVDSGRGHQRAGCGERAPGAAKTCFFIVLRRSGGLGGTPPQAFVAAAFCVVYLIAVLDRAGCGERAPGTAQPAFAPPTLSALPVICVVWCVWADGSGRIHSNLALGTRITASAPSGSKLYCSLPRRFTFVTVVATPAGAASAGPCDGVAGGSRRGAGHCAPAIHGAQLACPALALWVNAQTVFAVGSCCCAAACIWR